VLLCSSYFYISGLENVDYIIISTIAGNIEVKLDEEWSPIIVNLMRNIGRNKLCSKCRFYRAEEIPQDGAIDKNGFPGPPYAILQGTFDIQFPKEMTKGGKSIAVKRGMVAIIENGPNFYIATKEHPEWGDSGVIFGFLDEYSMSIVESIISLPKHSENWGGVSVTVLNEAVPFTTG
jgi:cyclophilin family peptidyl-prolyl cis-trans isomerase